MNFLKRYGALLFIAAAILMAPRASFAALTLAVSDTTTYQQTTNNPCVIGDSSCKEPTAWEYSGYNGTPGAQGSLYDVFSPAPTGNTGAAFCNGAQATPNSGQGGNGCIAAEYLASQITAVTGNQFKVGIDINYAGGIGPEALVYFLTFRNDVLDLSNSFGCTAGTSSCTAITNASGTGIVNRNGNGFSDAVLSTVNIASYASTDKVKFEARLANDTDGMEEFFLIAGTSTSVPTPEPASIFMLGSTLIGIGALARRRWNLAKRG